MDKNESLYYVGLPIIQDDEKEIIVGNSIFSEGRKVTLIELGHVFFLRNPKVLGIIEFDQDTWPDHELQFEESITEEQSAVVSEGIFYGYNSTIRIFSVIQYLRSGHNSIIEFGQDTSSISQFPDINDEEVEIVNKARLGVLDPDFSNEAIDFALRLKLNKLRLNAYVSQDATLIAELDFRKYKELSPNFEDLIDSELEYLKLIGENRSDQEFSFGFWLGVQNCLQMYLLLAQKRFFNDHFDQELRDSFDKLTN